MTDDAIEQRLDAAAGRLASLTPILERGGPWPLAARFDHAPEAAWGPREILAHVAEMLSFWLGETERILDQDDGRATFGRKATDDVRLAIIERDRSLPIQELSGRIQAGIDRWGERWAKLDGDARQRLGAHVTLGPMTVTEVANRFVVGHLEEHLDQLAEAADGGSSAR